MIAFNKPLNKIEEIDTYRVSRMETQFIRGLINRDFAYDLRMSLDKYVIRTKTRYTFVPLLAFLEAVLDADATYESFQSNSEPVKEERINSSQSYEQEARERQQSESSQNFKDSVHNSVDLDTSENVTRTLFNNDETAYYSTFEFLSEKEIED
jgi:hypothetical protein